MQICRSVKLNQFQRKGTQRLKSSILQNNSEMQALHTIPSPQDEQKN